MWDPPDPDHERRSYYAGRSNRSVGIVLLVVTALVAGGAVSYVLSQWQDSRIDVSASADLGADDVVVDHDLDDDHDDDPGHDDDRRPDNHGDRRRR